MELLATIGVAAKELFAYNREIYQFDQEQRLDRELLRLEMQVKRFGLFREDIRDLVELTVGKMKIYHAVGSLSLWFCITWYTEGRIRAEAPPFILALYWMSIAGAFVYLLLTVWLSMHASVTSHSFGVRLLTRFVRLPIPGIQQMNALNPRLTDFETQGLRNAMRLPFVQAAQRWQQRAHGPAPAGREGALADADPQYQTAVHAPGQLRAPDLLEHGEAAFSRRRAAACAPGKHIQLFRQLQAKWQCFDAYARVCMSLGMNQVLMSACFYLICATMYEYHSPSLCIALIAIFQSCSLAMSILDVSGVKRRWLVLLWLFGSLAPVAIAAAEVTTARHRQGPGPAAIYSNDHYRFCSAPFFLIAGWMFGLLRLAQPSRDAQTLPRLFRTVLFVDVFALEEDPAQAVGVRDGEDLATGALPEAAPAEQPLTPERAAAADEACFVAEAALRRWEAVPAGTSEASTQGAEVKRLRRGLTVWRRALNAEAARIAGTHGDLDAVALLEVVERPWHELSVEEQGQDPWAGTLLGPFEHNTMASNYYYDLEGRRFVWEVDEGRDVLALAEVQELVEEAERQVRQVLGGEPAEADGASEPEEMLGRAPPRRMGFVPERLPWLSLNWMTWALIVAWLFMGIVTILEQQDILTGLDEAVPKDNRDGEGGGVTHGEQLGESAARRLDGSSGHWNFMPADAGRLQGAATLSCIVVSRGSRVLGAPDVFFQPFLRRLSESQPLQLPTSQPPTFPPGTVAFCGGPAACLLGAPAADRIAFWLLGNDQRQAVTELPVRRGQWTRVAGARVHCERVRDALSMYPDEEHATWCLLLAGWGNRRLSVAAVPLTNGLAAVPGTQQPIAPAFDVLLPGAPEPSALHVAPCGRLWALFGDGALQAWDLLQARGLGSWRPTLARAGFGGFRAAALCEEEDGGALLVVGREGLTGPQVLRSVLPIGP